MKTVRMEFMRNPTQIRLYDIFRKDLHMPDDRAQNLVSTIDEALKDHNEQDREDLATKAFVKDEISTATQSLKDQIRALEVKTTRSIYFATIIQFLAIVGAILAIYSFLHK
jgi:hypothetical protein